ncbi:hypothetical protein ACGF3G_00660 [Streptomyces sp. NPDC048179]|uniref:hypothetical protein n=1 Tax=Streptomyces sp. NPDC048179 TaxID=3365506 RepID=UPI003714608C
MTTTADAVTFTFPSGATVDLPAGMTPCRTAGDSVTEDVSRFVTVGVTPAGREVRSHFSCAAYTRAAHLYSMREAVAKVRARAAGLDARGLTIKAANLRGHLAATEAEHAAAIADWTADPAPCTCPED